MFKQRLIKKIWKKIKDREDLKGYLEAGDCVNYLQGSKCIKIKLIGPWCYENLDIEIGRV